MNLDELRAVQVEERGTDSLQSLPDSFYRDVAAYVEELRDARAEAAERAENPFDSEEVRRLTDRIETAEEVVEAIYERRVGKVVKRASLAAAGMPADDEGLTVEESELFADLVDLIESNRRDVFAAFEGEGAADPPSGTDPSPTPGRGTDAAGGAPELDAGDVMGSEGADAPEPPDPREDAGSEPSDDRRPDRDPTTDADAVEPSPDGGSTGAAPPDTAPPAEATAEDGTRMPAADPAESDDPATDPGGSAGGRVTVRITRDVGEIFGVDERTYELGEEDVVTLPEENARPLLERDAAQKLE